MKIIINADDFGVDIDRDFGILYGIIKGYITSVSVIVTNKIGLLRKIMIAIMRRKVSVGIHINLTDNPLAKYKMEELCYNDYEYKRPKYTFWRNCIEGTINIPKIEQEILEQVNKFIKNYKFIPHHIDGHNHCNIFNKEVEKIFEELATRNIIHLRIPYEELENFDSNLLENNEYFCEYEVFKNMNINMNVINQNIEEFFKYDMFLNNYFCNINCNYDKKSKFIGTMYGYFRQPQVLKDQLATFNDNDTVEIMTHPGFYWNFIHHNVNYSNIERAKELKSLKKLKKFLKGKNTIYINYKKI